jgi:hypothetical protein
MIWLQTNLIRFHGRCIREKLANCAVTESKLPGVKFHPQDP